MLRQLLIWSRLAGVALAMSATAFGDELSDLRERLDAIEAQNETLQMELDELKTSEDLLIGRMSELDSEIDKKADSKTEDPKSFSAKWNHGFEETTKDKQFKFHVGGRVQLDGIWLQDNPAAFAGTGPFADQDAVDFRRARLRADGTMYETIDWCVEIDFVNSANVNPGTVPTETNIDFFPAPTDLWLTFREVPMVGNVRVGNVKEPIGLEHMHSSRYLDFMERSYAQDAFYGGFNNGFTPGIVAYDNWAEERGTWATGVFKNTTNVFAYGVGDGEYSWTSRLTYLPWYECDGKYLAHVGVAGSLRDPNNGQTQYRSRGSLRNGPGGLNPVLANTGQFFTEEVTFGGMEAAVQLDSLLIEGEFMMGWNRDAIGNGTSAPLNQDLGEVQVYGWYVQTLYFLTGEHRHYEKGQGVFGRVSPHENFGRNGGLGAWQVGARYNVLNLTDSGMDGGVLEDLTLGLNWFLNPNLKIQSNYAYTIRDAQAGPGGGDYYGFGTRVAWDF